MSQIRKLKSEIESTCKKVKEGLEEFDVIKDSVYEADTQAKKERYEADLKRQINKLQKFREILKGWEKSSDNSIFQFHSQIVEYREKIEEKMKEFKACEKETKTKAYSKEGLRQPSKQNPVDEKRETVRSKVTKLIRQLYSLVEECEVEKRKEETKKKNINQSLINKLEEHIKHHKWFLQKLETILRRLDNKILDPYDVDESLTSVEDYIADHRNTDFIFDNSIFDDLDLISVSKSSSSSTTTEHSPEETVASPSFSSQTPTLQSTKSIHLSPLPRSKPNSGMPSTPSLDYSQVIQRTNSRNVLNPSLSTTEHTAFTVSKSPLLASLSLPSLHAAMSAPPGSIQPPTPIQHPTPAPVESSPQVVKEPKFIPPTKVADTPIWSRNETISMLNTSYSTLVRSTPIEPISTYFPQAPIPVPDCYPQMPVEEIKSDKVLKAMDVKTLFFAFAYAENQDEKLKIAQVLNEKEWIWNTEYKCWMKSTVQGYISI